MSDDRDFKEETIGTIEFDPVNKDLKVVVDGHLEPYQLPKDVIDFIHWSHSSKCKRVFSTFINRWFDGIWKINTTQQLFEYYLKEIKGK